MLPRPVERAQPGHRVRRPALGRCGTCRGRPAGRLRPLRRPAAVRVRAGRARRRAPCRSPRVAGVGGGLRWADPRAASRSRGEVWCVLEEFTGEGPTDVRRVLAAVPLDGSAAEDRGRGARTDRRPAPVRHRAAALAGRPARRLARLGPPADAVGRHRGDGRARSPATGTFDGGPDRSPAAPRSRSPRSSGPPTARLLFVSDRERLVESAAHRPRRAAQRLEAEPGTEPVPAAEEEFGGPLWKIGQRWFAPAGERPDRRRSTAGAPPRSASSTRRPASSSTPPGPGPSGRPPSPCTAPGRRGRGQPAQRVRGRGAGHRAPAAPGSSASPHDDPVDPAYYPEPQIRTFTGPDGREIHAHIYPPHHPGPHRPRRRAAAVRGVGARRAHQPRPARARPGDRLLHLARHRRRRGQLRRLHRLRPRVPQPAARAVGRRRRRGLRRRRRGAGRRGHRRPGAARHPRRQRGRLDRRRLPRPPPTCTPAARSSIRSST